jgi:hypothetical protein
MASSGFDDVGRVSTAISVCYSTYSSLLKGQK